MGKQRTINGVIRRVLAEVHAAEPRTRVFALVDPARDPRIGARLLEPGVRARCLYGDDVPPVLAAVSPHLVPIAPDSQFGAWLASAGRTRAWSVLVQSEVGRDDLAIHFASLIRALDPDGVSLLFRFYDPRVLRVYLPTCTPDELEQVFGPAQAFLIEQPDGSQREYRRSEGRLVIADPRWDRWVD